jgi:hypothetical protein
MYGNHWNPLCAGEIRDRALGPTSEKIEVGIVVALRAITTAVRDYEIGQAVVWHP